MASLNKTQLIGRLVKDPELRFTKNGTATAKFTLAVNQNFKKGEEQQVDYINIVLWKNVAENCAKYIQKGSMIYVEGRLTIRSYEDSKGERKWITEVVGQNVQFLDKIKSNNNNSDIDDDNSDLPF